MQLVLATRNIHKVRELRAMLRKAVPHVDVLSISDFSKYIPPEETHASFEENAAAKAVHAATSLSVWTLADDSGLVVPALSGKPGVFTARYASLDGAPSSDKANRQKLLREMAQLQGEDRQAYFECCLALSSPTGLLKTAVATCEGTISLEEKGNHGFGYDSLFLKYEYGKTFAELEEEIKNLISHRRKAFEKLLPNLMQF